MAGWERSAKTWVRGANRGLPTPSLSAQKSTSLCRVYSASGMSDCRSSSTIFCDFTARSLSVVTFMLLEGCRQQEGASTRSPSISTMQARQFPAVSKPCL